MKNFSSWGLLGSLLLAAAPVHAEQKLLPEQSSIEFTSQQMGARVPGQFKKFDAKIAFDPKKPENTQIKLQIDLKSAAIGAPETEKELAKPEWFDSQKFPQAIFESTHTKALTSTAFQITGKLTIKGISREVVVLVKLTPTGQLTSAIGQFDLKRLDFKLGNQEWKDTALVANEVQVKFKLMLSGVSI
jgi:polyisoprenoid-binding protein YceI